LRSADSAPKAVNRHAASWVILPRNSVGAAQLKKTAVTGAKVKDGSLTVAYAVRRAS
jgi:hypothetical protein